MQLKLLIITVFTSTAAANYNATSTGGYIPTSTSGLSPIMTSFQGAAAPSTQLPGSALAFVVAAGVALVSYFPLATIPCSSEIRPTVIDKIQPIESIGFVIEYMWL